MQGMAVEFTLFEVPLVADADSPLAHPPMRAVFDEPDSGRVEKVWIRHRSSGAASLCILWKQYADWYENGNVPMSGLVAADLPVTGDTGKVLELVG